MEVRVMRFLAMALVVSLGSGGRIGDTTPSGGVRIQYPLQERRAAMQTMKLTLQQLQSLQLLSYSEDSAPKKLEAVVLGLFETDGSLPMVPSVMTVQESINAFMLQQLNTLYDRNHQVASVQAVILTQTTAASRRQRQRRHLLAAATMGSQLETQVSVTFANEPSPDMADVTSKVGSIWSSDLTPLLTELQGRAVGDEELAKVNAVYYFGNTGSGGGGGAVVAPTAAPAAGGGGGAVNGVTSGQDPRGAGDTRRPWWKILIPVVVAACVAMLIVALFATRRRRRRVQSRELRIHQAAAVPHDAQDDDAINLYWDSDDLFSIEAALMDNTTVDSPTTTTSDNKQYNLLPPQQQAAAAPPADDLSGNFGEIGENQAFSTSPRLHLDSQSPRGGGTGGSSVFSFLSGFASKASTVAASNVSPAHPPASSGPAAAAPDATRTATDAPPADNDNKSPTPTGTGTPHSRVSSLFTFSEEDSNDVGSSADGEEQQRGLTVTTAALASAPSDEEQTPTGVTLATIAAGTVVAGAYSANRHGDDSAVARDVPGSTSNEDLLMASTEQTLSSGESLSDSEAADNQCKDIYDAMCEGAVADDPPAAEITTTTKAPLSISTTKAPLSITTAKEEISPTAAKGVSFFAASTTKRENELARLSPAEITRELQAAEKDGQKKNAWGGAVESPAAASYNPRGSRALASPGNSVASNKTEPGRAANVIQLQWDDPRQVAVNRMKAAAFAGSLPDSATTADDSGELSEKKRFAALTKNALVSSPTKARTATNSAGNADGTDIYQNDATDQGSMGSSKESLSFRRGRGKPMAPTELSGKAIAVEPTDIDLSPSGFDRVRRHAKSTAGDGTANYQHETMGEWSVGEDETDEPSLGDNSDRGERRQSRMRMNLSHFAFGQKKPPKSPVAKSPREAPVTPKSAATNASSISGLSNTSPGATTVEPASPSKQLISDLLWLEQKIAANHRALNSPNTAPEKPGDEKQPPHPPIEPSDSLSFASGDGADVADSSDADKTNRDTTTLTAVSKEGSYSSSIHDQSSIVCRDCYAPPGKLKIVIHSTKDGPAVHTVKKGSSLEGHIFAGDLIISVDNVDTRSYSAEQVMKMMTAKTRFERKITVLHFEENTTGSM